MRNVDFDVGSQRYPPVTGLKADSTINRKKATQTTTYDIIMFAEHKTEIPACKFVFADALETEGGPAYLRRPRVGAGEPGK